MMRSSAFRAIATALAIGSNSVALAACSDDGSQPSSGSGDTSTGDLELDAALGDAGLSGHDSPTFDPPELGPPPDAGALWPVQCPIDASLCALPRSTCADSVWLVYYVGGECVDGWCHYEKRFQRCINCDNGGCREKGTK